MRSGIIWAADRGEGQDAAQLLVEILEFCGGPDLVRRPFDESLGRQVATTGIAQQHVDPLLVRSPEPGDDTRRETHLVPAVAGEDDIDVRGAFIEDVAVDDRDARSIRSSVQGDRGRRERVDVGGGRLGRTRLKRRDGA